MLPGPLLEALSTAREVSALRDLVASSQLPLDYAPEGYPRRMLPTPFQDALDRAGALALPLANVGPEPLDRPPSRGGHGIGIGRTTASNTSNNNNNSNYNNSNCNNNNSNNYYYDSSNNELGLPIELQEALVLAREGLGSGSKPWLLEDGLPEGSDLQAAKGCTALVKARRPSPRRPQPPPRGAHVPSKYWSDEGYGQFYAEHVEERKTMKVAGSMLVRSPVSTAHEGRPTSSSSSGRGKNPALTFSDGSPNEDLHTFQRLFAELASRAMAVAGQPGLKLPGDVSWISSGDLKTLLQGMGVTITFADIQRLLLHETGSRQPQRLTYVAALNIYRSALDPPPATTSTKGLLDAALEDHIMDSCPDDLDVNHVLPAADDWSRPSSSLDNRRSPTADPGATKNPGKNSGEALGKKPDQASISKAKTKPPPPVARCLRDLREQPRSPLVGRNFAALRRATQSR